VKRILRWLHKVTAHYCQDLACHCFEEGFENAQHGVSDWRQPFY
jgi:hypothetical protein